MLNSSKYNFKKILIKLSIICLWTALVVGVGFLFIASTNQKQFVSCKGKRIIINQDKGVHFIDTTDVVKVLTELGFKDFTTLQINYLQTQKIEKQLEKNPYIDNAEVFINNQNVVNIVIDQRKPLLRVFNTDFKTFYFDVDNKIIPYSDKFSAHVPVVIGLKAGILDYVNVQDTAFIQKLCNMASYIDKNEFWKAQVDQIIINESNEITIIPTITNTKIELGTIDEYESKFEKLLAYYKKNMKRKSTWDKYESINLSYDNQIVCKKFKPNIYEPTDSTQQHN